MMLQSHLIDTILLYHRLQTCATMLQFATRLR